MGLVIPVDPHAQARQLRPAKACACPLDKLMQRLRVCSSGSGTAVHVAGWQQCGCVRIGATVVWARTQWCDGGVACTFGGVVVAWAVQVAKWCSSAHGQAGQVVKPHGLHDCQQTAHLPTELPQPVDST